MRFYLEVQPHLKGALPPLRSLQRVRSFTTLILYKSTTKVKAATFSIFAQRAGETNFLGSSTTLETPKQPQPSRTLGSKSNKSTQKVFATSSRDGERGEKEKPSLKSRTPNLKPKGSFNQAAWERFQV
jgi:hypothetical protein